MIFLNNLQLLVKRKLLQIQVRTICRSLSCSFPHSAFCEITHARVTRFSYCTFLGHFKGALFGSFSVETFHKLLPDFGFAGCSGVCGPHPLPNVLIQSRFIFFSVQTIIVVHNSWYKSFLITEFLEGDCKFGSQNVSIESLIEWLNKNIRENNSTNIYDLVEIKNVVSKENKNAKDLKF